MTALAAGAFEVWLLATAVGSALLGAVVATQAAAARARRLRPRQHRRAAEGAAPRGGSRGRAPGLSASSPGARP